jgi:hypothetical protein
MPKVKISEYSATANSNTDVASINIDEGCAPSGINNAIRAVMGHLKDFQQGTNGDPFNGPVNGTLGATTASTANVTTLTTSSTVTHNGGTINGVAYLNGSKVLTTGSALTFDGTLLRSSTYLGLSTNTTPDTSAGDAIFYKASAGATLSGFNLVFETGSAGSRSEQMRLTSTSLYTASTINVGIGSTSPIAKLDISGISTTQNGLRLTATSGGQALAAFTADTSTGEIRIGGTVAAAGNYFPVFYAAGSERARITSGGYFKASNTGAYQSSSGTYHELRNDANTNTARITNTIASGYTDAIVQVGFTAYAPNTTNSWFLFCDDSTTNRVQLRSNGGIANYSANDVNLSDRREKINFAPAGSYLDKICAIPVQTFNYIDQNMEDDGGLTLGVVAQDVQAIAPELVMESDWAKEGDEPKMRLSIYQTDLQYALMKCIQEQQALITQLTARITALEGA